MPKAKDKKTDRELVFNIVYRNYCKNARRKNLSFSISREVFRKIISSRCFYCGSPPSVYKDYPRRLGVLKRNGLDRVDNTKGYSEDNVVACCKKCNMMKRTFDVGEFIAQAAKIAHEHSLCVPCSREVKIENSPLLHEDSGSFLE